MKELTHRRKLGEFKKEYDNKNSTENADKVLIAKDT